jgi:Mg2+-importing ATPase
MFFYICPLVVGGPWASLTPDKQTLFMALFHSGWFVESLWSQTLVIHMIRTPKIPFIQSRASGQVALLTTLGIATGTIVPYTWLGKQLDMMRLPPVYFAWLVATIFAYMILATIMKKIFVWKYGELL